MLKGGKYHQETRLGPGAANFFWCARRPVTK
jgi:hypothetical protein